MSSAGKEGGTKVAALYIRVSTLDQAREGYSLAAQQAALEAWAAAHSYATQLYADEGISGKDIGHRPAMRQMLADVEAGKITVVAVWALSRLTRSVADLYTTLELLAANGVALISHTEAFDTSTPTGRAMMGLLGVLPRWKGKSPPSAFGPPWPRERPRESAPATASWAMIWMDLIAWCPIPRRRRSSGTYTANT